MLSRKEIENLLDGWLEAWNRHDLDAVLALFHDDVLFDHWNGVEISGKRKLRAAWAPWFANHGGFEFEWLERIIDEKRQRVLLRWRLHWPSRESGHLGERETRDGVDLLAFSDGLIISKLTYSKTAIEVEGERVELRTEAGEDPGPP